ncbi:hypothetical protein EJB05_41668, partial [Eragrostis curvula]
MAPVSAEHEVASTCRALTISLKDAWRTPRENSNECLERGKCRFQDPMQFGKVIVNKDCSSPASRLKGRQIEERGARKGGTRTYKVIVQRTLEENF